MPRWREVKTASERAEWATLIAEVMPDDPEPPPHHVRWLLRDDAGDPIAACSATLVEEGEGVYLSIAAVHPRAQGRRLQASAVRLRERWGRKQGATVAITYTAPANPASMRTLIRCGYRPYSPQRAWVGRKFVYWRRRLTGGG